MKQIICKICNFESNTHLFSHIRIHNMTIKQYYDLFLKIQGEGKCKVCCSDTKFNGLSSGYTIHCSYKCSNNNPEIIKKQTDKCIDRYGGRGFNSIELKNKSKVKCLELYGTEWFLSSDFGKNIVETSFQKSLGFSRPFFSKVIQNKVVENVKSKYGVDSVFKLSDVRAKIKRTLIKKYGVDNISKVDYIREQRRHQRIKEIEQQKLNGEPLSPNIGKNERLCLDELQIITNFKIKRNVGMFGYFADGYIEEKKLVIEYDESSHYNSTGKLSLHDIHKDEYLIKNGLIVFRIKDIVWRSDKSKYLEMFRNYII